MTRDPKSLLELLRLQPHLAFDRARRGRPMPAIHRASIATFRSRLSHVGLDGVRRAIQPDFTFVAHTITGSALRKWALLVDVLPHGRFDAERVWTWPFVHATLRDELGVPTLHLVFAESWCFAEIIALHGWEPELVPILVGSLDADADAIAEQRLRRASGYD